MFKKRVATIYFILLLCLSLLSMRLYILSDGNRSSTVLSGQYTRRLDIAERSGFIYDRNLQLLSHKVSHSRIVVNPSFITENVPFVAQTLSQACNTPVSEIYSSLYEGKVFTLKTFPGADTTSLGNFPGIYKFNIYEESVFDAVHLMGYKNSDGNAVCGLLLDMSDSLNALSGRVYARFDANAMSQSMKSSMFEIVDEAYTSTDGLVVTLNKDLQHFTRSLEGKIIDMGAIIITDINTGEILAVSSYPSYDSTSVATSLNSDRGDFLNRSVSLFTPGSVFKLVVAASALEKNQSLSDFSYECTGSVKVGKDTFHCHNKQGHGVQNLEDAFANSCNTYFIKLGQTTGIDQILETSKKFGLGKPSFADTLVSTSSNLPDADNCPENLLANISFGQGTLLLSPLDLVNVTNACATGFLPTLSVIKGVRKNDVMYNTEKKAPVRVLSSETCEKLKVMMKKCVQEGTGKKAQLNGVNSGGKTATAQTGQIDKNGKEILHTWFCGIYPVSSPKYSIIILCDGNSRNNSSPAEIFRIVNKHLINCGY